MDSSKILVARSGDLAFVQVVGRGSFQNAGQVKSFYLKLLDGGVTRFAVDLNDCTYLDSTFLGTLTGLGQRLKERASGRLHIINVNARNLELLQTLGLDRLFSIDVVPVDYKPPKLSELPESPTSRIETGRNMLEAHQNLMNWDERNIPKFKDVVAYLREDLGEAAE